jgi:hypothetical protein
LALTVEESVGLQRVDAGELSRAFGNPAGVVSAHRFVTPEFELRAQADHVKPAIDAVVRHRFAVTTQ